MQTATAFHGYDVIDDAGLAGPAVRYNEAGQPASSGPQPWFASTFLASDADAYRLDEVSATGVVSPVVSAVPTTDCPIYGGPGARFQPLKATRILDTRSPTAVGYSGPKPGRTQSIDLQVTNRAGVPSTATAVSLNITMTEATGAGFVQAFPTGQALAGTSSNINADAVGQTIANTVIVPIGVGGKVTLFTSAGAHLLADVSGFFSPVLGPVAGGRFVSVTPRRVLDTRTASLLNYLSPTPGATPGTSPGVGANVRFNPVTAAGLAVAKVAAVAINLTATEAAGAGYVQVAPSGTLVPGASSNVNVERGGQTIANMVIVPVSAAGEIDIFTQAGTHLVVDVLGWFTNATNEADTSGLYYTVTPERVLDTRPETAVNFVNERRPGLGEIYRPAASGSVDIRFDGLPEDQVGAVVVNLTATDATAAGFVQAAAQLALNPGASSNVNVERAGQTIANAAIVPVNQTQTVTIYTQSGAGLIADISGFFRR